MTGLIDLNVGNVVGNAGNVGNVVRNRSTKQEKEEEPIVATEATNDWTNRLERQNVGNVVGKRPK